MGPHTYLLLSLRAECRSGSGARPRKGDSGGQGLRDAVEVVLEGAERGRGRSHRRYDGGARGIPARKLVLEQRHEVLLLLACERL